MAGQPASPQSLRVAGSAHLPLLTAADFSYAGQYTVWGNIAGTDPEWGAGFTHRYVNGQLRFLFLAYASGRQRLVEVAAPPALNIGIANATGVWHDLWPHPDESVGCQAGIWWDEAGDRLWTTLAADYPNNAAQGTDYRGIHTRRLNANGSISDLRGPWKLGGVGQRKMYGGFQRVPQWFRSQYGAGEFAAGWGGYCSLVNQYVTAPLGGTFYTMPDPAGYPGNTDIPSSAVRIGMQHGVSSHRGRRLTTDYKTYYDTVVSANPPPDTDPLGPWDPTRRGGIGYWDYGDSYYNTGSWIDGPGRHGFVAVASLNGGKAYYHSSTLHSQARRFELHVYNPLHFGEAIVGDRSPDSIQPTTMFELHLDGLGAGRSGNGPMGNVSGASYDPVTRRLYVYGLWLVPSIDCRIYVFDVNV